MKQPSSWKVLFLVPVVALLAAGCASNQPSDPNAATAPAVSSPSDSSQTPSDQPAPSDQQTPPPSGNDGNASSTRRGFGMNIPEGSKPFFGMVGNVSGSSFMVSGRATTTTIDITSDTQFQGGSQNNIANGTRVAGYGTPNTDGSINAQSIQINPTFGGNRGGFRRRGASSTASGSSDDSYENPTSQ